MLGLTLDLNPSGLSFVKRNQYYELVQRYFTELSSTLSQYYTIPTWTATGDFEVPFEFESTSGVALPMILGNLSSTGSYLYLSTTGFLEGRCGGANLSSSSGGFNDGRIHRGVFRRVGSTISIDVDETPVGSVGGSTGDFEIDVFGRNQFSNYFNGIIANVSLTESGGDNRLYKLDEDFDSTTVVKNSLATLGGELFDPPVVDPIWSEAGGVYTKTSTAASGRIDSGTFTLIDSQVLYSLNVNSISAGSIQMKYEDGLGGINTLNTITTPGIYDVIIDDPDGVTRVFFDAGTLAICSVSDFTVKQADGYGTAVNISQSDLYDQDGNDWLGVELAPDGTFSKTTNAQLAIDLLDALIATTVYRISFNYDNNTSSPAVVLGGSDVGQNLLSDVTDESYALDVLSGATIFSDRLAISGPASRCELRNTSVKRLLEVA